jgi:HD-GYP domain-containing protein (c-di-GMP phosphodiesterase class II)
LPDPLADLPELRDLRRGVEGLRVLARGQDPRTSAHERRVAGLCGAIARELGLTPLRVAVLELAAGVHDIGKLQVPVAVLHKAGDLSEAELRLVRAHARHGHDALALLRSPLPVAEFVLQHHERVDGRGYPQGLGGGDLHLESKILAAADVYDAIAAEHSYRAGRQPADVAAELKSARGTQLDAAVVDALLRVIARGAAAGGVGS